jgi:hypothetical protein
MKIRKASERDFEAMWPIFRAIMATGDTYFFSPEAPRDEGYA